MSVGNNAWRVMRGNIAGYAPRRLHGTSRSARRSLGSVVTFAQVPVLPRPAAAIPWRVAPPLISTALIMLGSGFLGTLLPLRFSAMGLSDGVIGVIATAEAFGFLGGCLYAHKVIAPVGLGRACGSFDGLRWVAILCFS